MVRLRSAILASVAVYALAQLLGLHVNSWALLAFAAVTWITTVAARLAVTAYRVRATEPETAALLGNGAGLRAIAARLARDRNSHIKVVGEILSETSPPTQRTLPTIGTIGDLAEIVRDEHIDCLIASGDCLEDPTTLEALRPLADAGVDVHVFCSGFSAAPPGAKLHWIQGVPLLALGMSAPRKALLRLKRTVDIIAGTLALILISPLMAAIALGIKVDSPGPVFYRQERLGRGKRPFNALKFRSMRIEACRGDRYGGADAETEFAILAVNDPAFGAMYKFKDDPRVTRFGRLLRSTSLDELPQLVNVIRGQMSLVGPRPITRDELGRYGRWNSRLYRVPPGMTGYWQVNGRSEVSYDERVHLDMAYIDGWSFKLDMMIACRTLGSLRSGAP